MFYFGGTNEEEGNYEAIAINNDCLQRAPHGY
jgi:hypothetical protein